MCCRIFRCPENVAREVGGVRSPGRGGGSRLPTLQPAQGCCWVGRAEVTGSRGAVSPRRVLALGRAHGAGWCRRRREMGTADPIPSAFTAQSPPDRGAAGAGTAGCLQRDLGLFGSPVPEQGTEGSGRCPGDGAQPQHPPGCPCPRPSQPTGLGLQPQHHPAPALMCPKAEDPTEARVPTGTLPPLPCPQLSWDLAGQSCPQSTAVYRDSAAPLGHAGRFGGSDNPPQWPDVSGRALSRTGPSLSPSLSPCPRPLLPRVPGLVGKGLFLLLPLHCQPQAGGVGAEATLSDATPAGPIPVV